MLIDNWMFRFLSFKFIFDLVAYKDRIYVGIYLSAKITKTLFTWREGNPAGSFTLLVGLPSSIVFPGVVYMRGYPSRKIKFRVMRLLSYSSQLQT